MNLDNITPEDIRACAEKDGKEWARRFIESDCKPVDMIVLAEDGDWYHKDIISYVKGAELPWLWIGNNADDAWRHAAFPDKVESYLREKEQSKKLVPFDLSDPKDRDFLRGKWVRSNSHPIERMIGAIIAGRGVMLSGLDTEINMEELLDECTFLDGSACGKEVEYVRQCGKSKTHETMLERRMLESNLEASIKVQGEVSRG